jgi:two-component system sensor histidine kinase QseC
MKSIRRQLTQSLVLGILLIAGGGGAVSYLTMRAALLRQFDDALLAKAQAVAGFTEIERGGRLEVDPEALRPLGFGLEAGGPLFTLSLLDGDDIVRSSSAGADDLPLPAHLGDGPTFTDLALPEGVPGRAVAFVFVPQDEHEALVAPSLRAALVVASPRRMLDQGLWALFAALALNTGLLAGSAWVLVPRVLRRELKPLEKFSERVALITADSLATRLSVDGAPAELSPIVQRLNDLLSRLEAAFERERRFSAELAHELRTPLAELRSQAELALKWPDARKPSADAETLAIAMRMERLVVSLLAMARAESGHAAASRERIALEFAVQDAWRSFAGVAAERGLRVCFRVDPECTVEGDPVLLREILANLLSNAVAYSPAGGRVEVDGGSTGGAFLLTVTNSAESLAAADVDKLFDRFWRKEAARSDEAHCGLGLALARTYAQALGWELRASLDQEYRITFTLSSRG